MDKKTPVDERDWKSWAQFLAMYVEYHHGKAITDRAWDLYVRGKKPTDT